MSQVNDFNTGIIEEFRSSHGVVGGPFTGAPLVLLTTTGAKSGKRRTNPLATLPEGGRITDVVLDVAGMAWFERLLLQLGPAARVVRPAELTGLASDAARRVLARYQ
jgi:hypothetical protein